jgi:hypothetical protein
MVHDIGKRGLGPGNTVTVMWPVLPKRYKSMDGKEERLKNLNLSKEV